MFTQDPIKYTMKVSDYRKIVFAPFKWDGGVGLEVYAIDSDSSYNTKINEDSRISLLDKDFYNVNYPEDNFNLVHEDERKYICRMFTSLCNNELTGRSAINACYEIFMEIFMTDDNTWSQEFIPELYQKIRNRNKGEKNDN